MLTADLDYHLPPDRIATTPAEPRDHARLMVIHRKKGDDQIEHRRVQDLPEYFERGDLLVVNETRVLPAFLTGTRTATGGKVTGLYLGHIPKADGGKQEWRVLLESKGKLQEGEQIELSSEARLELLQRIEGGQWRAALHSEAGTMEVLQSCGDTPLPPYIRKARKQHGEQELNANDRTRYNTVYAATPGSVAAPTAGLHFTPGVLDALAKRGVQRATVTLHVGLGTFAPVRTQKVEDHPIHREWISIPAATIEALAAAQARNQRVIPIGTTTVRALESLPHPLRPPADGPAPSAFTTETSLFITPDTGFTFRFADGLMTNFHLPRSTLLALVAAMPDVGVQRLLRWYNAAVEKNYRFYSYGDAMLIL